MRQTLYPLALTDLLFFVYSLSLELFVFVTLFFDPRPPYVHVHEVVQSSSDLLALLYP